jgi:hypothetical protein
MWTAKRLIGAAALCGVACLAQKAAPTYIAVVSGQDIHVTGSMTMVSNGIAAASGARIESAKHNAMLKLTRGGEVALCESSALSLEARGSQLWLALQTGTLEGRFPLSAGADTLVTPDYRLSLISGSGMPGQMADFRIGIGSHGDLLVQVLAESESYITVSSNFETMQAVVRPGEVRGFPAFGSTATPAEVVAAVPLRCPVEKSENQALTASVEHEPVPPGTLSIPLAYRAPELPEMTPAPTPTPEPEKEAEAKPKAEPAASAPPAAEKPTAIAPPAAPATETPAVQAPAKPVKRGNFFRRLFRKMFGPESKPQ